MCRFAVILSTVNLVSKLDRYPIPHIEDLFSKLAGGKSFTKLDLSQAYLQIPLDDSSKELLVINTYKDCFVIHGCMAFPLLPGSFKDSWRMYCKGCHMS